MPTNVDVDATCVACGKPMKLAVDRGCPSDILEIFVRMATHDACVEKRSTADHVEADAFRLMAKQRTWEGICPERYREPLYYQALKRPWVEAAQAWEADGERNLVLWGPSGRGKTPVAFHILRREHDSGKSVAAISHAELRLRMSAMAASDSGALAKFVAWLAASRVLLLDDLGKGRWTAASEEGFAEVVDARYRRQRPIIITTELDVDQLSQGMSDERVVAVMRRLYDGALIVKFVDDQQAQGR